MLVFKLWDNPCCSTSSVYKVSMNLTSKSSKEHAKSTHFTIIQEGEFEKKPMLLYFFHQLPTFISYIFCRTLEFCLVVICMIIYVRTKFGSYVQFVGNCNHSWYFIYNSSLNIKASGPDLLNSTLSVLFFILTND